MNSVSKKYARLTKVAKMYYEENMTQNEIAREINVSRPMVSKLVAEARELGVVTIIIGDTADRGLELSMRIRAAFGLLGAVVIPEREEDLSETNARLARAVFDLIRQAPGRELRLGLGWGGMILNVCDTELSPVCSVFSKVIPLSGGFDSKQPFDHCNGLAYSLADKIEAEAELVFFPASAANGEELTALKSLTAYSALQQKWDRLDAAVVEIEEPLENESPCAGKFLGYSYDRGGAFLRDQGFRICASVQQVRNAKKSLAVAGTQVSQAALLGALRTGVFTHAVMTEKAAVGLFSP